MDTVATADHTTAAMDLDSEPAKQQPQAAAAAAPAAPAAATNGGSPSTAHDGGAAAGPSSSAGHQHQRQQQQQEPSAAAGGGQGQQREQEQPKRQAKRKVAMHLAYLGAGYHGMQRNPGCPTIETELEAALVKAGAISEQNAGSFQKIHWNRAARTDKGVSALCQVVSAKLITEPKDTFAERVNQHLPAQVRVFGVQRATEGFDARKFCDKRKYEYILPAWAFDPQAAATGRKQPYQQQQQQQPARKAERKPVGSSAARLADEAAALQAIAAAVLAADATQPPAAGAAAGAAAGGAAAGVDGAAEPAGSAGAANTTAAAAAAAAAEAAAGGDGTPGRPSSSGGIGGGSSVKQDAAADELASTSKVGKDVLHRLRQDIAVSRERYVFGESQLQRLNGLLAQYEGTHNYHNFTVRVQATAPEASRYILSFQAEVVQIEGQPWVRLVVLGQSFMLHQIRKMVGLVLAIMRGVAPEQCLQLALDPDRDINTPMAPELGLFLDETYYDAYNNRFGELHGPISFEPYRQAASDFKYDVLYKHIAALDERELVNALWLRSCTEYSYRFSRWAGQPKARESSASAQQQRQQQSKQQRQQQQANGQDHKRKQQEGGGSPGAGVVQQQQQPAQKQQRLERPGKLAGASAAMVVGMQETYGMRPHSDTQQAAEFRQELKEMRDDYAKVQQQQQQQQSNQQQQLPEVAEEELESLYD